MQLDYESLKTEDYDGERHIEREYTAYAKVPNFNWMDEAKTREMHEQWFIDYDSKVISGRLRLINGRRFTEAVKQKILTESGHYECEQDISPDMYEMKKLACKRGYLKERFTFPTGNNGLVWEVDVFKDRAGGRSHWIKIDLEYIHRNDPIPDFPFAIDELIVEEDVMSEATEEAIDRLWQEEWLCLDPKQARSRSVL